ncbi:hypothetical protein RMCBS344292_00281 [Rhizopus microsporus]|nr:hypothetical protein RMCBS344292_00281 [Rhizopus microsporus]
MGIKKLFSSSSKEAKYNPRRESTMSSISSSIGKWAQPQKRRTIPTVTTDSHPQNSSDHTITSSPESMSSFEQEEEKIQLPVTPSPSDEEEDNKREDESLMLYRHIADMKQRLNNVNERLNDALEKTECFETKFKSLSESTKQIVSGSARLTSENKELRKQLKTYEDTIDKILENHTLEGDRLQQLESLCTQHQKHIDSLEQRVTELQSQYESYMETTESSLREELKQIEQTKQEEMEQLRVLHQSEVNQLSQSFKEKYAQLEEERDAHIVELKSKMQTIYERQENDNIRQHREEAVRLQLQIDKLMQENASLKGQIDTLNEHVIKTTQLEKEIASVTALNLQLTKQRDLDHRGQEELHSQISILQDENRQLKEQLTDTENMSRKTATQIMDGNEQLEKQLHERTQEMIAVERKLKEENQKLQAAIESLQQELSNQKLKPEGAFVRTKSRQQDELMRMHTKAQLSLIEYLEGEDDVVQALSRFKKQLEVEMQEINDTEVIPSSS